MSSPKRHVFISLLFSLRCCLRHNFCDRLLSLSEVQELYPQSRFLHWRFVLVLNMLEIRERRSQYKSTRRVVIVWLFSLRLWWTWAVHVTMKNSFWLWRHSFYYTLPRFSMRGFKKAQKYEDLTKSKNFRSKLFHRISFIYLFGVMCALMVASRSKLDTNSLSISPSRCNMATSNFVTSSTHQRLRRATRFAFFSFTTQ